SWQNVAQSAVGLGHKSLIFAAKTMAATIIDLMTSIELIEEAKKEHKNRLRGRVYKSPIPPDHKPPIDIWKK
ncbi:MAG: amidohydrolase, partial [Candidatus Methanomethylicia archaeon]